MLVSMKKMDEAIAVLDQAIKRNGQDEQSYLERARLYFKMGKMEKSLADYTKVLEIMPTSKVYTERSQVYMKMGKAELARQDMEKSRRSLDEL